MIKNCYQITNRYTPFEENIFQKREQLKLLKQHEKHLLTCQKNRRKRKKNKF